MIEWWQAFLISVPSALLASLLTAGVALLVQRREHSHDGEMQAQRLESERRGREEEALRAMKRARMQPLFDALSDIEPMMLHLAIQEEPDGIETAEFLPEFPSNPIELGVRVIMQSYRLDDVGLRSDIIDFVSTLVPDTGDARGASLRLAVILTRLEAHGASVD